jgi:hypothetical protein
MTLARRLPELLNRSDRLDAEADATPEGSPRRDALKRRSAAEFARACALDVKIVAMPPQDSDDAVAILSLAVEFGELVDNALATNDLDHARADLGHLRNALSRVFAFVLEDTAFDLSVIGREEMSS